MSSPGEAGSGCPGPQDEGAKCVLREEMEAVWDFAIEQFALWVGDCVG